jgi:hypothetical protein
MKPRLALLVLALSLTACAASVAPARRAPVDADHRIATAEQELARAAAELHQEKAASAVDCQRAVDLTATICKLAGRICSLVAQEPSTGAHPRCQDANLHCERARQDTAAVCSRAPRGQEP